MRAFVDRYAGFNGGFFDYIKYSITGGNTLGSGPIMPYNKGENNQIPLETSNKGTNQLQLKYDQNEEQIDADNDNLQDREQATGSDAGGE